MSAGRAFELAGLLFFAIAVIGHIRSVGRPVLVRLDDDADERPREDRDSATVDLQLSPRRVRLGLVVTVVAASAASVLAVSARLHFGERAETVYRLLNVDFEGNLPTWISAVLLLLSAGAAGLLAAVGRHAGERQWRAWALLAAVVALSADEAASLHELMVEPLRALVGGTPWLRYPLIVPGLIVVAAGALVFGRLFATFDLGVGRSFYRGVGLYFLGALVLETAGGWFDPTVHGENAAYVALSTLEEACEMMGAALVFVALMRHAQRARGTPGLSARRTAVPGVPAPDGSRPLSG